MRTLLLSVLVVAVAACGGKTGGSPDGSHPSSGAFDAGNDTTGADDAGTDMSTPDSGSQTSSNDAGTTGAADGGTATSPDSGTPPTLYPVTFNYTPGWDGVTEVDVIGAFGTAHDWDVKNPFLVLGKDNAGHFTGTAMLPAGSYSYLFAVWGDTASQRSTFLRYAVDPASATVASCPVSAPTYQFNSANPCAQVTAPQAAAPALVHVRGTATLDMQPAAGWLAVIDRDEDMSHHYFVNRVTTGADGSFDLVVGPGTYQVQLQHPTILSVDDTQRDPTMYNAFRRALSSSFQAMSADVMLNPVELAYHDYDKLSPKGSTTLPVTFTYTQIQGAKDNRISIYSVDGASTFKGLTEAWYSTNFGTATSATWDGSFTAPVAQKPKAASGETYYWGTWQGLYKPSGGLVYWNGQSMVVPLTIQ